ncbi:BamA/TamA family outer membrane protein [Ancylomarina longa]|nr:BamA/TamA family outer membrane protein [Ancylomarina longa]
MKKTFSILILLFIVVKVFSQDNRFAKAPNDTLLEQSIFFIGDLGEADIVDANINFMKFQLNQVAEKGTLVILGNSIAKKITLEDKEETEQCDPQLQKLLDLGKSFKGELIIIPGDREWSEGEKHGWEALMNLETYVEDYLGRGDVFLPSGGCPGPVEINLTNDIVLLIVDSQWWLHLGDKPESECGLESSADFLILLSDALKRNQNKKIVIATHHPIYSAGKHGGNFPFPGPVELYRKFFGSSQDFAYPHYKQMRYMAKKLGEKQENIITVSAHDNSLQFAQKDSSFFVVSGSGSKADYVSDKKMDIAIREIGFARLNFYTNDEVWLEFWSMGENGLKPPHLAFRTKLYTKKYLSEEDLKKKYQNLNYQDSVLTVAASNQYETDSKWKQSMLGSNYRKDWATPIKVPVFDIGTEKGGLRIIKRGGGQQTRSLRLEAADGKQYVLRSVEKYTAKAIPLSLQGTFAAKLVQDGISESYPYAAIAVPKLAEAAGVYHTNPRIVYVPDDPRFGIYRDEFKNDLFLFEERPKGDVSDMNNFGNSKSVLGTDKLIEKRYKNSDLSVDETAVLRARLFDIFLNDWDRHDDQWRWATFKEKGKIIARPIPRDRDQVFFYSNGKLPWLIRRKWGMPKFQPFDTIIENVNGLGFNSRYFDRSFLESKSKSDWEKMAADLKSRLTDQVIESAVRDLPKEAYKISGEEIIRKLKARRNQLPALAIQFYDFLSKQVDVVGTNAKEVFDAEWNEKGDLHVTIHRLSKKDHRKELLFDRTFVKEETKEVRLYGLKGKDKFNLIGKRNKGVKLRVIGGKGKDKVHIENTRRQNVAVYDKRKTKVKGKGAYEKRLSGNSKVNAYNRKDFKYDIVSPGANLNFVSDDGLILGAGVNVKTQKFRKEPYGSLHKFLANYAFMYPSVELKYSGEMIGTIRSLDFLADIDYNTPNFQGYYFGLGNRTKVSEEEADEYNRIRMAKFMVSSRLRKRFGKAHSVSFGLFYQQLKLKATPDRFVTDITNPAYDLNLLADFNTRKYIGVIARYNWDTRDSKIIPRRGLFWTSNWSFFRGLNAEDHNFQKMETDLRFYTSLGRTERSILAIRVGAAHNTNGFSFYQSNKLGLKTNLRGYRQDRFAGKDMVYQNTDLRFRLARFKSYYLAGEMGLLGFNDFGRVWIDDENSEKWHHGFGGGFWLSPFKLMVLTTNFSHSTEDDIFSIEFKYLF